MRSSTCGVSALWRAMVLCGRSAPTRDLARRVLCSLAANRRRNRAGCLEALRGALRENRHGFDYARMGRRHDDGSSDVGLKFHHGDLPAALRLDRVLVLSRSRAAVPRAARDVCDELPPRGSQRGPGLRRARVRHAAPISDRARRAPCSAVEHAAGVPRSVRRNAGHLGGPAIVETPRDGAPDNGDAVQALGVGAAERETRPEHGSTMAVPARHEGVRLLERARNDGQRAEVSAPNVLPQCVSLLDGRRCPTCPS